MHSQFLYLCLAVLQFQLQLFDYYNYPLSQNFSLQHPIWNLQSKPITNFRMKNNIEWSTFSGAMRNNSKINEEAKFVLTRLRAFSESTLSSSCLRSAVSWLVLLSWVSFERSPFIPESETHNNTQYKLLFNTSGGHVSFQYLNIWLE